MFLIVLLRLISLVVFSTACTAFFAIFLICVIVCLTMAIIMMITVFVPVVLCLSCFPFGLLVSTVFLLCPMLGLAFCCLVPLFCLL